MPVTDQFYPLRRDGLPLAPAQQRPTEWLQHSGPKCSSTGSALLSKMGQSLS